MLRRKFITQEDYQKVFDTLDIEMVEEEEIKEEKGDYNNPLLIARFRMMRSRRLYLQHIEKKRERNMRKMF